MSVLQILSRFCSVGSRAMSQAGAATKVTSTWWLAGATTLKQAELFTMASTLARTTSVERRKARRG